MRLRVLNSNEDAMNLSPDNGGPINLDELGKALGAEFRRFRIQTLMIRLRRQKKSHQSTAETLIHLKNARVEQMMWEATL